MPNQVFFHAPGRHFQREKIMTSTVSYSLRPVGFVRSRLTAREDAPKQGSEGAPEAWVDIDPAFTQALDGIAAGQEVVLVTWLHQGRRYVLRVHPRDDLKNPLKGVFATRSPDRPNPIGLHRVRVLEVAEFVRLRVESLEALDGTPVIDIKPVLPGSIDALEKFGGVMSRQYDHCLGRSHTHSAMDPIIAPGCLPICRQRGGNRS